MAAKQSNDKSSAPSQAAEKQSRGQAKSKPSDGQRPCHFPLTGKPAYRDMEVVMLWSTATRAETDVNPAPDENPLFDSVPLEDGLHHADQAASLACSEALPASISTLSESSQCADSGKAHYHLPSDSFTPDLVRLYLNDIGRFPLLKAEEEISLSRKIQQGDQESLRRMIESNLRLVVTLAKRYRNPSMEFLDFIAEGNLGLMRSVEKYDPERGCRFSTYASWWIKQTIERGLINQGKMIRIPVHVSKSIIACKRVGESLSEKHGKPASCAQIARATQREEAEVKKLFSYESVVHSADAPIMHDSEKSMMDSLPAPSAHDPETEVSREDLKQFLEKALLRLPERYRQVIVRRFGLLGHESGTLEQVGRAIGLTRERVRQLQMEGLARLRRSLSHQGYDLGMLLDGD